MQEAQWDEKRENKRDWTFESLCRIGRLLGIFLALEIGLDLPWAGRELI